jgi:Protein of unknown function (DUF3102)
MLAVRDARSAIAPSLSIAKGGPRPELARLAGEIGWYEEQARKTVMLALQYKLEIGRRLAHAKKLLPHGSFLSWANDEFGWSPRHVQRHLQLVENAPRVSSLPPGTSLRMALAIISRPPSDSKLVSEGRPQPIHISGDIEPATIDRERLLIEISRLVEGLGAQKMRWKIR